MYEVRPISCLNSSLAHWCLFSWRSPHKRKSPSTFQKLPANSSMSWKNRIQSLSGSADTIMGRSATLFSKLTCSKRTSERLEQPADNQTISNCPSWSLSRGASCQSSYRIREFYPLAHHPRKIFDRSRKRACRVGKKGPPRERPAHSVTHQHRGCRVRQHLVCNTAEHYCG